MGPKIAILGPIRKRLAVLSLSAPQHSTSDSSVQFGSVHHGDRALGEIDDLTAHRP